jgi:pyrroline-5-carboxylate reductase
MSFKRRRASRTAFGSSCADIPAGPLRTLLLLPQVILAVKPQNVESVFSGVKGLLAPDAVLVSIVAGMSMDELQRLSGCAAIVRTMPNTPAMIGQGMTVWCSTDAVDEAQAEIVQRILTAMGHEIHVQDEECVSLQPRAALPRAVLLCGLYHVSMRARALSLSPYLSLSLCVSLWSRF